MENSWLREAAPALGRHRPRHRALACMQGQERGCQRASDSGAGKPRAAQAPARSRNVPIRLHLGASRAVVRSRISAHGCQGGRGCEIHVPRAFPHAAARLRVQARQRRPRHSRHPSLSRPPIDHVHGPLHGLDTEPVQKLLEGLAFQASRIKRRQTAASVHWFFDKSSSLSRFVSFGEVFVLPTSATTPA